MVSLPVLQNCNHFGCSYNRIFIEQSSVCVHFSSFVQQCERSISSCCVPIIVTAFAAEKGAWHCTSVHEWWEMFSAAVIMLAKFQIATVMISVIDWHKPLRIPQNAELHSTCYFFAKSL